MKKILLDSKKNYYKANLHCHSTKSDGAMTVEEIKELYKGAGYSVVAFTDHEHLIDNSHLNDDEFLAITSCELAVKEFVHLSPIVKKDMKVCHLNIYAKDPTNIDTPCYSSVYDEFVTDEIKDVIVHTCGEYERGYTEEAMNDLIRICNEKGFLVSYNHPRWSLENATDYLRYKNLWGVEVYNHSCMVLGLYEYDINTYDDFLRDGQKVACFMSDDNHHLESSLGGYVMINTESLDYASIMKALEEHNFYSSTGPVIKELYIEGDEAVITYEKGAYASISTKGRRAERKKAENPDGENTVRFKFYPEEDIYIRLDVVDQYGRRANTNAYFISDIY